ncbi:hypothetical protein [Dyella psychrodurans]|uniref:Lipoprotein n=1 Tax=Dyella psychrodurans TaxID=1927960 RepID=A0A370WVD9_9GAMM|nr:hypothetical protein [Dyella psychrodurans]RDS79996.1 hypothetical protein DWU99_20270 [Dyella psychrodurans]
MKRSIVGLLALACAGCAPIAKVNLPPDAAKSAASLPVSDVRPADEKEKKLFSLLITSKEYGIIRNGDEHISPSPVDVLQYEAFHKFGADHKVTVYHFVIYMNAKAHFRSQAVFAGIGGILGGLAANAVANHSSSPQTQVINQNTFDSVSGADEYERAYFTHDENPNNAPIFIVYLDTDIDGERIFTRTVAPMQKQGDEGALAAAVELAVKDHLSDYGNGTIATTAASQAPAVAASSVSSQTTPAPMPTASPAAVVPSSPMASATPQAGSVDTAMTSKAQDVANQMGCGIVQSDGNSGFTAPCGDHGIYIGCDGDACRPMHTVNMKANE